MNYLTNYYKNLSEQLQEKLNHLEKYVNFLSEDLEPGTLEQGAGPGAGIGTGTTTPPNQNNNSNDLNALLQAWGSSNPQFDLNRDGVVDGDDLGLFLANMLNRGQSSPTTMASTALPGTPETETLGGGQKAGRSAKALDQPGLASGKVGRMFDAGAGVPVGEKKNQTPPRLNPKTPYSPEISPSTAKFSPAIQSPTPGNIVNAKAKVMASNKNRGVSEGDIEGPRTPPTVPPKKQVGLNPRVSLSPEQYTNMDISQGTGMPPNNGTKPGTDGGLPGDFNNDGFVDGNDLGPFLAAWNTDNPLYDINGDGNVDGNDLGSFLGLWSYAPPPPPSPPTDGESETETTTQQNTPYWMSGRTTDIDTLFRAGQRRRRK